MALVLTTAQKPLRQIVRMYLIYMGGMGWTLARQGCGYLELFVRRGTAHNKFIDLLDFTHEGCCFLQFFTHFQHK